MADTKVTMQIRVSPDFDTEQIADLLRAMKESAAGMGEWFKYDHDTLEMGEVKDTPLTEGYWLENGRFKTPRFDISSLPTVERDWLRRALESAP